jgi:hypothetical protein
MVQDANGNPVPDATFMLSYANREEKGSDVNVAAHLLVDVLTGVVDGVYRLTGAPMPCGPSTTTTARSRTPLRRTPPVSGSGEGMAWRSLAGSSARLAIRKHPGG